MGDAMLVILDGWSVHRSQQFRTFMKTKYPHIHLAFLPPNCTSLAQPADTGLQRPLKSRLQAFFDAWATKQYLGAHKAGISPADFKLDVSMHKVKPLLVKWLIAAWSSMKLEPNLVSNAWVAASLNRLLDPQFRARAVRSAGVDVADTSAKLSTPSEIEEPIESAADAFEHDEACGLHDGEVDLSDGLEPEEAGSDDELVHIDFFERSAPVVHAIDPALVAAAAELSDSESE